jgi:hypothetical protein
MASEVEVVSPLPNAEDDIVIDESAIANTLSQLAVTRKKKPAKRVSGVAWFCGQCVVRPVFMPSLWALAYRHSASSCSHPRNTHRAGCRIR